MKIIVKVPNCGALSSRQIRNYIGSIVDKRYEDSVMWHKHTPSDIIYVKPFKHGFEIVFIKNYMNLINHVISKIKKNPLCYGRQVELVWVKNEQVNIPSLEVSQYETRTPIILASNKIEHGICHASYVNGNKEDMFKYITHRITSDLEFQFLSWFGINIFLPNLSIKILEYTTWINDYDKNNSKLKVLKLKMKFLSNYLLPRFVGKKIGLGYGEIIKTDVGYSFE